MKKNFSIICITLVSFFSFSQIKSGEKFVYTGAYNLSGIMTPLAQVILQTSTVKTVKSSYLHLTCEASTYSKWDSFFKIRDVFESYVNQKTLLPSLFKRITNEGGFSKTEKYVFKGTNITSTAKRKNKPETIKNFTVGNTTQDIVSIIYKLRTLDFGSMKVGQSKTFMVVFDEKEVPVSVKYLAIESYNAGNLGNKNCYKLSVTANTKAIKGSNLIWLTADEYKVPALIKFSIKVGVGQLTLTSAIGI